MVRTDDMCENSDCYLPCLWVGRVDQLKFNYYSLYFQPKVDVRGALIADEDVMNVLSFIAVLVEHVEGNEPFDRHKMRLLTLFKGT